MGCTQSGIQRRSRSHDSRGQGPATPVVVGAQVDSQPTAYATPPSSNATTVVSGPATPAKGGCGAGVVTGNAHRRFDNNFAKVKQKVVNCDGVNDSAVPLCSVHTPEDGRV
ncbi:unnamed protein product, partial [Ixodes hexagonus]